MLTVALSGGCSDDPAAAGETDTDVGSSSGDDDDDSDGSSSTGDDSDGTTGSTTSSTDDSTTTQTTEDPSGSSGGDDTTGVDPTGDPVLPPTSPGCGSAMPAGYLGDHQLNWGAWATSATVTAAGYQREYIVTLPPNYDPNVAYPMHIVFHAWTGNMDNAFGQHVENRWDEPVIAIAPQGQPVQGSGYGWEWWELDSIDYAFFDALVQHVGDNLCVDNQRIFTSGTSNGAYMAEMVACMTGYVRGTGASAGGMPLPSGNCINPVTAFLMHGSADTVVPISEGTTARDTWLQLNGCSNSSVRTADNRCDHYNECSSGQDVYWCQHGGGHPGADPNALGMSEAMMDAFQAIP